MAWPSERTVTFLFSIGVLLRLLFVGPPPSCPLNFYGADQTRKLATQIELALHQHKIDRQLRQQREWLRVTLSSIGDAVIATDAHG